MKKTNLFFAGAAVMLISATGLSSCKDDDDLNGKNSEKSTNNSIAQFDSIYSPTFTYNYGSYGPEYDGQYNIKSIDYGMKQSDALSADPLTPGGIALNIISWVAEKVATGAASKAGASIFDAIVGDTSGNMERLNEISDQIAEVNSLIRDLSDQLSKFEYTTIYNTRMDNYTGLDFLNCTYYTDYYEAVKAGNQEKAQKIAEEWASKIINGTDAITATYKYINMITTMMSSDKMCMPDIYDFWIFNTIPWEHEGYTLREQLRLSDVNVATSGYIMARAYISTQEQSAGQQERVNMLNTVYNDFMKFYKTRTLVKRHSDYIVCQISGAHIVFNKNIVTRDMKNHPWFPCYTRWQSGSLTEFMYGESDVDYKTALSKSLSKSEAQAIYDYYVKKAGDSTFERILRNAGFDMSPINAEDPWTHAMTLCDGGCSSENEHWYNYNYFLRFNTVAYTNCFCLLQSNYTVGCMWIPKDTSYTPYDSNFSIRWWDHYMSENTIYWRTNIDHRYSDNPFE